MFPGLEQCDQVPTQAADLGRQGVRDGLQPPLEGAPGGIASLLGQQAAHLLHLSGGLLEDRQQGTDGGEMAHNHDHQGFEEHPVGVDGGSAAARRSRWDGDDIDELDQGNQQGGIA